MVITENAFNTCHVEFGCKDPGSNDIKVKGGNVDVVHFSLGNRGGTLKNFGFNNTEWEAIRRAVKRHPKAVNSGPNGNAATEEGEIPMRVEDEEGGPYKVLSCFVGAIIEATNRPTSGLARFLRGKGGGEQDQLEFVIDIHLSDILDEYLGKDEFAVPALENLDSSREELDRHLGFAPFNQHAEDLTEWLYKVGWKLQYAAKDGQLDRFIPTQVEKNKSFTSGEISPNLVPPYFAPFYEALNGLLDNSRFLTPDEIKGRANDVLAILEKGLKDVRELTDSNGE
jgi:hypothetical protein